MKTHSATTFYIYLRKSSEGEDRQVQSIERQSDEVHKMIQQYGIKIAGTFQESRSAMIPNNRPEFSKMVKGIKAGNANGIICWHINRLARNPLESGIIQQLLEDGKIKTIITKDREYTRFDNSIIFSVESSLATQYSKDLGKMVKSGMEKKAAMGIMPSRAPLGYLNTKMAEHGSNYIIKDPERFDIVKQLWKMMLTKQYTLNQLRRIITEEYHLTPRITRKSVVTHDITTSGLYELLTNPFYAGLFYFNGKLFTGKHEPMITMEEFDAVQRHLGRNTISRYKKHQFTYRGIMQCIGCTSAITAIEKVKLIKSRNEKRSFIYYYCTQRKSQVPCSKRQILTLDELEKEIQDHLKSISISEKFLFVAVRAIEALIHESGQTELTVKQHDESTLIKTEAEIKNLLHLRINNLIDDTEYEEEKLIRQNKLLQLKQKISQDNETPLSRLQKLKTNLQTVVNIHERFMKAGPEERRIIFSKIGENHALDGKKLNIDKPLWLNSLQNHKPAIDQELVMFELEKHIDVQVFYSNFRDLFPSMCALIEEVRTGLPDTHELINPSEVDISDTL